MLYYSQNKIGNFQLIYEMRRWFVLVKVRDGAQKRGAESVPLRHGISKRDIEKLDFANTSMFRELGRESAKGRVW